MNTSLEVRYRVATTIRALAIARGTKNDAQRLLTKTLKMRRYILRSVCDQWGRIILNIKGGEASFDLLRGQSNGLKLGYSWL